MLVMAYEIEKTGAIRAVVSQGVNESCLHILPQRHEDAHGGESGARRGGMTAAMGNRGAPVRYAALGCAAWPDAVPDLACAQPRPPGTGVWLWRSSPLQPLLLGEATCGWLGRFVACTTAAVASRDGVQLGENPWPRCLTTAMGWAMLESITLLPGDGSGKASSPLRGVSAQHRGDRDWERRQSSHKTSGHWAGSDR